MQHYTGENACFEHSNFSKVNALATRDTQRRAPGAKRAALRLTGEAERANQPVEYRSEQ